MQHFTARAGVIVDQDGNRYASPAIKLAFLRDCLLAGIRSGNLKPITTDNQREDLKARIAATELEVSK